jgi:hypothetical protein
MNKNGIKLSTDKASQTIKKNPQTVGDLPFVTILNLATPGIKYSQ